MRYKMFAVAVCVCIPVLLLAQWSIDPTVNTIIIDTTGDQVQSKIVVNESGESYISWFSDFGSLRFDVYMQRLDADGNKLWAESGLLISNNPTATWTTDYGLVIDSDSNAVLVNQDTRTGYSDVFTYRISPDSQFLWGNNGIQLTDDEISNYSPTVVTTEQGDVIFAWVNDKDTTSIGLQRVSPCGEPKWGTGIEISDTLNNNRMALLRTEDDNVVVAWCKYHDFSSNMHIFVQKLDSLGNPMWTQDIQVDTGGMLPANSYIHAILENDSNGGVFVLWNAVSSNNTNFVQHLNADGNAQWSPNGIEISTLIKNDHNEAALCYLPTTQEIFVFWKEYYYDGIHMEDLFGLYGQKLSYNGERLWSDSGLVFESLSKDTMCSGLVVVKEAPDNDVTVFYLKEFDTFSQDNVMAMRLNGDGGYVWANEKVIMSSAPGKKLRLSASDFAHNQWICVWTDMRNSTKYEEVFDIYAQNIQLDGTLGTGIEEKINNVPSNNILLSYPNPFYGRVMILYSISSKTPVSLKIYDLSGCLVQTLVNGVKSLGSYTVEWDAKDYPANVYFARFAAGDFIKIKKLVLMQ